jgi:hypothetical protein
MPYPRFERREGERDRERGRGGRDTGGGAHEGGGGGACGGGGMLERIGKSTRPWREATL